MLRFTKRSRLTFSSIPDAPPSSRPQLWTEVSSESLLPPCEDSEPTLVPSSRPPVSRPPPLPKRLPPPLPLRHPPSVHTKPPVAPPVPVRALPPMPRLGFGKVGGDTVSPATIELADSEVDFAPRGRPSLLWAAALLVAGGVVGFGAALVAQPDLATQVNARANRVVSLTSATIEARDTEPRTEPAPPAPAKPTTLSFDTPLEIRVPVARQPAPPAAPAVSPVAPAQATPKTAPARVETSPAAFALKPITGSRTEPTQPTVKAVQTQERGIARRDLPPSAVDALVKEQLRSALH